MTAKILIVELLPKEPVWLNVDGLEAVHAEVLPAVI
jgi:hypothetical protein